MDRLKLSSILLVSALLFVGCATVKQAKDDAQLGYMTPLSAGEVSPQQEGAQIGNAVAGAITMAVPVAAPLAVPIEAGVAAIAGLFLAWQRGRGIRKQQEPSTKPITGFLGNKAGLEAVVQNVASVSQGVTELFKEGSTAQHAWQGLLTGLVGLAGTAIMIPGVRQTLEFHPEFAAYVGGAAALFNGLQQALTQVKPVSQPPTNP